MLFVLRIYIANTLSCNWQDSSVVFKQRNEVEFGMYLALSTVLTVW